MADDLAHQMGRTWSQVDEQTIAGMGIPFPKQDKVSCRGQAD